MPRSKREIAIHPRLTWSYSWAEGRQSVWTEARPFEARGAYLATDDWSDWKKPVSLAG